MTLKDKLEALDKVSERFIPLLLAGICACFALIANMGGISQKSAMVLYLMAIAIGLLAFILLGIIINQHKIMKALKV